MKTVALVMAGVVVLIAVAVTHGVYRNNGMSRKFDLVHVGQTKSEVVHVMGSPAWTEPCGQSFGTRKPNCTEFIYRNSFAPYVPEYWSVSFDVNGSVIDTFVYESP